MIPIALLIPLVCGTHVQAVVNYCEVIATKKLSNAFKGIKICGKWSLYGYIVYK